jgi:S-DNA-T family DNA segregation ATPase FtsK/SpoIIIE
VVLVDYRRTLAEAVPPGHLLSHCVSPDSLREVLAGAVPAIGRRVPGPEISPSRMRQADWWKGPRLFVVVDDYEMVGGNALSSPFEQLLPHLPLGWETGLHLVVARSSSGAARSTGDPLVRRLLEINSSALLLSCPPGEGVFLNGVRPRLLPPGRAQHVVRRRTAVIQTAMTPAPAPA